MDYYSDPDRPFKYSYRSVNRSLINAFYKRYWLPLVIRVVPEKMSANLISIIGDTGVWISFLILAGLVCGPMNMAGRQNPWIFGIVALLLFFYHTMDSLDGMQARRTASSGPLGEFVDHWFDAFNAFLIPLGLGLAFPVIPPLLVALTTLLCGLAGWVCARTTLKTGVMEFGPISSEEALLFSYLSCLAIWAFGYDFWAAPGPLGVAPVVITYSLAPIAFLVTVAMDLKRAGRLDLFAILLSSLMPFLAWTLLVQQRIGNGALLSGCLLLGFAGARFSGDVLRERLLGFENKGFYPDLFVVGALLLVTELVPGLPAWMPPATVALSLIWTFCALCVQFSRTVGRVRDVLGVGLFDKPRVEASMPEQAED